MKQIAEKKGTLGTSGDFVQDFREKRHAQRLCHHQRNETPRTVNQQHRTIDDDRIHSTESTRLQPVANSSLP